MTYQDRLRDPRWQRRRLQKMQDSKWACEICSDTKEELHVHHKQYDAGCDPWEYSNDMLQCLCDTCHQIVHMDQEKVGKHAKRLGLVVHTVRIQEIPMRRFLNCLKHGMAEVLGPEWQNETHRLTIEAQSQLRDVLAKYKIASREIEKRASEMVKDRKASEADRALSKRAAEVLLVSPAA